MRASIAVAMSGGVDSSTAAWLLQQQGYRLFGVTLDLFDHTSTESADAAKVADQLGFPHHTLFLHDAFRTHVMDHFAHSYEQGRTPNPCVECNRHIKFGALLDQTLRMGAEKLATGHYAQISQDSGSGRWLLHKALHPEKDQSYVLYGLSQHQLSHSLFPLGKLSKDEIRTIAAENHLISAHKRDSQDICFIPDGDYGSFIRRHTNNSYPSGCFLNEAGSVLGTHTGIVDYTIGQRRGLGVSSNQGRLYVKQVCPAENTVILSDNQSLFSRSLAADCVNWIACDPPTTPLRLCAKIRYRMTEQPCVVEQVDQNTVQVTFDQPQRAITPGQAVVFYDGDCVVGGASITAVLS